MPQARPVLAVVPARIAATADMERLLTCLVTLQATTGGVRALVVDQDSPARDLLEQFEAIAAQVGAAVVPAGGNSHAGAVNAGLREALALGCDALVVDPAVEFTARGWLPALQARTDTAGRPAAVAGGLLLYPDGMIEQAGLYYSLLRRDWSARMRFGPAELPEALLPCRCPVGDALQLIRHEALAQVGFYDRDLPPGREAVDFCLRVFAAGLECIYEPAARATRCVAHAEPELTPEQHEREALARAGLMTRHSHADMARWVPALA